MSAAVDYSDWDATNEIIELVAHDLAAALSILWEEVRPAIVANLGEGGYAVCELTRMVTAYRAAEEAHRAAVRAVYAAKGIQ